jgi:hypothetical protein
MSYCRWSSDDWKSDVYAYESERGYEVHVAGNHYTSEIPPLPEWSEVTHDEWFAAWKAQMEAVKKTEREKIGGEYDCKDFLFATLQEFLDGLKDIASKGYHVPSWTLEAIQEEIDEGNLL